MKKAAFDAIVVSYDTLLRMKREAGRGQDLADVAELEFIRTGSYEPRSLQ